MECYSESECNGVMIFFIIIICMIFVGIVICSIQTCMEERTGQNQIEDIEMEAGGFVDRNFVDQKEIKIDIGGI